jgi:hypothetical protein
MVYEGLSPERSDVIARGIALTGDYGHREGVCHAARLID